LLSGEPGASDPRLHRIDPTRPW